VLADPVFQSVISLPAAGAALPVAFANDAALLGVRLFAQTFQFDAGAAGGVSESRGLQVALGR
jgi:hypothetical protein